MSINILISTSSFGKVDNAPLELLQSLGNVKLNPFGRKLTEDEIKNLLIDTDFLLAGTEPITENVLRSAKKLKGISRCGVGLDNVNMDYTRINNIKVANTPDAPTCAVAELTLGLILSALRHLSISSANLHSGLWKKQMGSLLTYKTVGIIGFGKIGQKLADLLSPFEVNILVYDINYKELSKKFTNQKNIQFTSLEHVISNSDILSFHANTKEVLLGKKELEKTKQDVVIVNVSRGEIILEKDITDYLLNGKIGAFATDVFHKEPYSGPLQNLENVILTPHIGSYAKEARIKQEMDSAQHIADWINSKVI